MGKRLDSIEGPADLQALGLDDLRTLCGDLREVILQTVSRTGGHLAANLGVVELTVALLRVFKPPHDRLVWDVGHQAYAYKLLTGRRARFATLRQYGGLCGFTNRAESEYDPFGAGHAGTALSAALGMAVARDRLQTDRHVVAIVGDGSMGCGLSLEALNQVSSAARRLVIVLNDNEMSIAGNVGALSRYFGRLLANPRYNRWKRSVEHVATRMRMGWLRRVYYRIEEAIKSLFLRSVVFEELGIRYIGPVDGHDLPALVDALTVAREYERPILVHVATRKGRGYRYAEAQPEKWHGAACFDVDTGEPLEQAGKPSYSSVCGGCPKRFPDRFFDVGICEEHAVVFAAGLAAEGYRPVFAVYSTFLQRAVDCVIHDVCLQNLPVIFCVDRAGVVGDDGPTHHGVFDLALLRAVPGLTIMQPRDEAELARMLTSAMSWDRPCAIRYPRGTGTGARVPEQPTRLAPGRAEVLREGTAVQLWALGDMVGVAMEAASLLQQHGVDCGVINARFVKPLDLELLRAQSVAGRLFGTLENGVRDGGFGSAVEGALGEVGFRGTVLRFGWPDRFVAQGSQSRLMADHGLTALAVADQVRAALGA